MGINIHNRDDQCALVVDADSNLKDASEIGWSYDKDSDITDMGLEDEEHNSNAHEILPVPAVSKLRAIIRFVNSSPQRRDAWLLEIESTKRNSDDKSAARMLILDVKTRWSSTHQMLRCALDNRDSIETFILRFKNLQPFKLSEDEWDEAAMISMDLSSCINIH